MVNNPIRRRLPKPPRSKEGNAQLSRTEQASLCVFNIAHPPL